MNQKPNLLEVENLSVRFETRTGSLRAVDGVSFALERGETLGVVGESGSGKSVTSLAVIGLVPPPGVVEADAIRFDGGDLLRAKPAAVRALRGRALSMIFQDPMTSLNPLLSIERQLSEVLEIHEGLSPRVARQRCATALGDVGIASPEERLAMYPHELSGGLRQRVMIAMALLCRPQLLIADEPTTALDVTVQAQILELLKDLQRRHGMAIVLITHSLGVVAGVADRVQVMYAGRIVETAPTPELFARPLHPYTQGLLASVPSISGDVGTSLTSIAGQPPDLARLAAGCAFEPRCAQAFERCRAERPRLAAARCETARETACFLTEVTPMVSSPS